jgi:hypothetical protein
LIHPIIEVTMPLGKLLDWAVVTYGSHVLYTRTTHGWYVVSWHDYHKNLQAVPEALLNEG